MLSYYILDSLLLVPLHNSRKKAMSLYGSVLRKVDLATREGLRI